LTAADFNFETVTFNHGFNLLCPTFFLNPRLLGGEHLGNQFQGFKAKSFLFLQNSLKMKA